MEFVIFALLAAVVFVVKIMSGFSSSEARDDASLPRGVMGEAFPAVEPLEPVKPAVSPRVQARGKTTIDERNKKHNSAPSSLKVATKQPAPVSCESEKSGYAIKNKNDVKKAIVYAEVFNKKYF